MKEGFKVNVSSNAGPFAYSKFRFMGLYKNNNSGSTCEFNRGLEPPWSR